MATISELTGKNGKAIYRCQIRKKNKKEISVQFKDKETAHIFASYHETLLDMEKFEAKDLDIYTLGAILAMKYPDDSREYSEIKIYFTDMFLLSMRKVDYKFLMDWVKGMLDKKVQKGGVKGDLNTGIIRTISPTTIIRKLAYLSAAINHAISLGIDIENPVLRVISYIRTYKEENMGQDGIEPSTDEL